MSAFLLAIVCRCGLGADLAVAVEQNSGVVPPYEAFELAFRHDGAYGNPFLEATVEVAFTAPSGKEYRVGGFYYSGPKSGEAPPRHVWKARFAPAEKGLWRYQYAFARKAGGRAAGKGTFRCVPDRATRRGFVRQDPIQPTRWVFDDGTPYYPVGLQDMFGELKGRKTVLSAMAMEGPFRPPKAGKPPAGALFQPGPSMGPVNADVYFRRYARCGFDLFRHPGHFAPRLGYPDHPELENCVATDEMFFMVRKYGYRILFCLYGWSGLWCTDPNDAKGMAQVKQFTKYAADRWGAYVDFWEFFNEDAKIPPGWYAEMTPYLHSVDPYRHPVTTSWPRPELTPHLDFESPHHYSSPRLERADAALTEWLAHQRRPGKPILVGEFGNHADRVVEKGIGGVWDPDSALRMRVRLWTALFNEASVVFWNTSYAKDGHYMNMWLGPREREYVRALQDFAARLGPGQKMLPSGIDPATGVRAYQLESSQTAAAYLYRFADRAKPVAGLSVAVRAPRAGNAYWYDPATAAIVKTLSVGAGPQRFDVPSFDVDLALLVVPQGGAPDIDRDGTANAADDDDDNDGLPDARDAFPLEPEERGDRDGDLIGDVLDADDSPADGLGDDDNGNGTPDHLEDDLDGDGVPRANAVPWDAFPWDAKEWADRDGDAIGDNSDPDIDGDGYANAEETRAGTDPKNPLSFPVK